MSIRSYQFPIILCALSLILRLAFLSSGPFHVDCLNLAIQAERTLDTGKLHYLFGFGYPLTVILGACFIFLARIFGVHDPVIGVNLMSAVFSSLSVGVLYLFVRRLGDELAAFFSALFFSIFPIFLTISVFGTSHTPSVFFLLTGLVLLLNYHKTSHRQELMVSGILFGCMGAAREHEFLLMILPVSFLFFFPSKKQARGLTTHYNAAQTFGNFLLFWAAALGVCFLFHLPLLFGADMAGYSGQMQRYWVSGLTNNYLGMASDSLIFSLQQIFFGMTPIGAVMGISGLFLLFSKDRRLFGFLMLWLAVPLLFYGNMQMTEPRFLIIPAIALIIAMGIFLSYLLAQHRALFDVGVVFTFCTITLILFVQTLPILRFRHTHALLPDFARYVEKMTEPEAVVITADEGPFIRYYGHRAFLSRPYSLKTMDELCSRVDILLDEGTPVYITSSGLLSGDPHRQFSGLLLLKYDLSFVGQHFSEDWHRGATRIRTGYEKIYRLQPRL